MTTIAFDGITMAADRQLTGPYIQQIQARKIFKHAGFLYAATGCSEDAEIFENWIKAESQSPPPKVDDNFHALKAQKDQCWQFDEKLVPYRIGIPVALGGNGASAAMGVMLAGKSSRKAVEIAAKLDPNTGQGIQTMKV